MEQEVNSTHFIKEGLTQYHLTHSYFSEPSWTELFFRRYFVEIGKPDFTFSINSYFLETRLFFQAGFFSPFYKYLFYDSYSTAMPFFSFFYADLSFG